MTEWPSKSGFLKLLIPMIPLIGLWWIVSLWRTDGTPETASSPAMVTECVTVRCEGGFQCPAAVGSGRVFEKHIPFHSGLRLMSAIDKAGGLPGMGNLKSIRIVRAGKTSKVDLRKIDPAGSNHPLLQAGDMSGDVLE